MPPNDARAPRYGGPGRSPRSTLQGGGVDGFIVQPAADAVRRLNTLDVRTRERVVARVLDLDELADLARSPGLLSGVADV